MSEETGIGVGSWYMNRGGPARAGVANGEHLRLPLELRWKVKTALHADREPLTWGHCAVLWSMHEVWAVHVNTGKRLGTFTLRDLMPDDPGYDLDQIREPAKGNGVLCTVIDPDRGVLVVFVLAEHRLYARRLPDLAPLWEHTAPPVMNPVTKMLSIFPPLVLPGRIIWTGGGAWVGCIDSASGGELWRITLPVRTYSCSSDSRRLIVGTDEGVVCLSVETGAIVWTAPVGKTPVYVALANGVGYACPQHKGLVALDLETGKVIWSTPVEPYGLSTSPCVLGEGVYGASMHGLYAYSVADGRLLWQNEHSPPYQFAFRTSNPVATEEHIIVGGGAYEYIYVFSRETGEILWAYKTKSMVHSSPVVYQGKVLIGSTDRHYYCFESATK